MEMSFDSKIAGWSSEYSDPYTIQIPSKLNEFPSHIQETFNRYIEFHNNATSNKTQIFNGNKFVIARTASGDCEI